MEGALVTAPAENANLHLVFLRSGRLLLVRRATTDWRVLQDEFADFMASLGPMTSDDAIEWLGFEYGADPRRDEVIAGFVASGQSEVEV
jgi:hypothetical protein